MGRRILTIYEEPRVFAERPEGRSSGAPDRAIVVDPAAARSGFHVDAEPRMNARFAALEFAIFFVFVSAMIAGLALLN